MLTALLLGLAGSLHCVAMCGPLIMALPLDGAGKRAVLGQMTVYHSGRILSYVLLGVAFGLLGKGLAFAGLQKTLSLTAGVFMIAMAFMSWRFERMVTALPGFGALTRKVQTAIGQRLRGPGKEIPFVLGMFNGLLPCGMVYAALAGALASFGGAEGGLFMAVFGLGTLPLLLTATVLGRSFSMQLRQRLRLFQPVLLALAGMLLLMRGLQLDLSIFESAVPRAGYECH